MHAAELLINQTSPVLSVRNRNTQKRNRKCGNYSRVAVAQHTLGDCEEMYFVESAARTVVEEYQRELGHITRAIRARNTATSILYENLIPSWIPNSQYLDPACPDTLLSCTSVCLSVCLYDTVVSGQYVTPAEY